MNALSYRFSAWLARSRRYLSLVPALCAASALAAADQIWTSTDARYRLGIESEIEPLPINRLHRWTLTVTRADGTPVEGASIAVVGGMPVHDHGLPTAPQVTRYLGDGRYLLEGMRFHMQGEWEISVAIEAGDGSDTVLLKLDVGR